MENEKDDLLRSTVINEKRAEVKCKNPDVEKFEWVKEFVFSTKLEIFVALAGVEDELFLIDIEGRIVEYLENE